MSGYVLFLDWYYFSLIKAHFLNAC